ncbi:hypothetical protein GL50803_0021110 [Giardia duodenalis]|uniref:Cilia- and flagella-associated protein 299 n=3 Tax=Giardia intestinalis TaxID=5741 RepID=A8BT40_GIAIC|nr:hypothetical protein GL50803_0021110 [Giardia intestinalis]EFO61455.1 Flagellar/basal body protein [Giardia lamblia P15]ESU35693.1 Hypothetical protein DHA2_21110 [Giardia intestinalis]KAE8305912.1 hypothetical protein GL50803_0021110 [Giardia intestinalis]|eukprot:XP_001705021.1 Hypothetical protein GL50803_21110 [Giardia lamblia ATCC 50803]
MSQPMNANLMDVVQKFKTYEEYLDSHIKSDALFFLESQEIARAIVETSSLRNEILKRDEFEAAKKEISTTKLKGTSFMNSQLASTGLNLSEYPFLFALAQREEQVRDGRLACIIFIRDRNHSGQEISGYIDYAHRLKTDNFVAYFTRAKKLLPRSTDLSFYNWDTQFVSSLASNTFEIIADNEEGFLFKCKRDRKVINVNPTAVNDDKTVRHVIDTHEYMHVVIYDHILRRKI